MIKLKAYHGTLKKNVNSIKENGFIISTKNFEWLGTGIYFFADKEFAEQWALQESLKRKGPNREPAVLSAIYSVKLKILKFMRILFLLYSLT